MSVTSEFEVGVDNIIFTTRANGDKIEIKGVNIDQENATNLASLVNSKKTLTVKIEEK